MCLRKKVLSSQTCQKMTSWQIAKNLMWVVDGSSHRTCIQSLGVNCSTALFSLPVVEWMSLIDNHKLLVWLVNFNTEVFRCPSKISQATYFYCRQYSPYPIIQDDHCLDNPGQSKIPVKTQGSKKTVKPRESVLFISLIHPHICFLIILN